MIAWMMPMSDKTKLLASLLWIVTNRRCLETLVGTRNIHRHVQANPKGWDNILGCSALCSTSCKAKDKRFLIFFVGMEDIQNSLRPIIQCWKKVAEISNYLMELSVSVE